jgi:hypothetical protein
MGPKCRWRCPRAGLGALGTCGVIASLLWWGCAASSRAGPGARGPGPVAPAVVLQIGQPTSVRVNQIVRLLPPRADMRWSVGFDETFLRLTEGTADAAAPQGGWTWKALAPGHTEIVLTGKPTPCPRPPCGPNVPRIVVSVDIVKP